MTARRRHEAYAGPRQRTYNSKPTNNQRNKQYKTYENNNNNV